MSLQESDFECLKSKEIMPNETGLVYNERFKQKIIPDKSSVHIPVEIYDGGINFMLYWAVLFSFKINDPDEVCTYQILNRINFDRNAKLTVVFEGQNSLQLFWKLIKCL